MRYLQQFVLGKTVTPVPVKMSVLLNFLLPRVLNVASSLNAADSVEESLLYHPFYQIYLLTSFSVRLPEEREDGDSAERMRGRGTSCFSVFLSEF